MIRKWLRGRIAKKLAGAKKTAKFSKKVGPFSRIKKTSSYKAFKKGQKVGAEVDALKRIGKGYGPKHHRKNTFATGSNKEWKGIMRSRGAGAARSAVMRHERRRLVKRGVSRQSNVIRGLKYS